MTGPKRPRKPTPAGKPRGEDAPRPGKPVPPPPRPYLPLNRRSVPRSGRR